MMTAIDTSIVQEHGFEVEDDHNSKEEALQVLRSFLKQHPWSVSDPGPPSSRIESPPREYISSPLLKGGFELETTPILRGEFQVEEQNFDQGNYHALQVTNAKYLFDALKTVRSKTLGNKEFLKGVFMVLNVLVEACQAVISQGKNEGKMGRHIYLKLSIITSSICLTMALVEAFHEGQISGVVWQKRGYCCWFYYPGNHGRLFGRFSLYFGLISSMVQLIINLTEKFTKKDIVQFDYMPLLLAVCYLVAAMIGSREKKSATSLIRCSVQTDVVGTLIDDHENRLFRCPQCQVDDFVEHNGS